MNATTTDLVDQVMHLPEATRAYLAEKLLESLDQDDAFPVSQEWLLEIRRRCKEIDDGTVRLVSATEVFAEMDQAS